MSDNKRTVPKLSRRQALMRLGIAAGAIYAAPALVNLDSAHASRGSGGGRGSGGNGGSGGGRGSGGGGNGGGNGGSNGGANGGGNGGSHGGSGGRRIGVFWKPFW